MMGKVGWQKKNHPKLMQYHRVFPVVVVLRYIRDESNLPLESIPCLIIMSVVLAA